MAHTKPREVQAKLMRGLLDLVVLQLLHTSPMHGYQLITSIRKSFGVYFGPSTIYPLLTTLEDNGYVQSRWDMTHQRPRKVYALTKDGQSTLNLTEDSLELICRQIGTNVGQSNIGKGRAMEFNVRYSKTCSEDPMIAEHGATLRRS